MKVKQIIVSALNLLGRPELAQMLSTGAVLDGGQSETVNTLLYCFNAVEDELARKYMPLNHTDCLNSSGGKFMYTAFTRPPVKISRVTANGAELKYKLYPQYMQVNANSITVDYEYSPVRKKADDDSDFNESVGENLLALGTAAEYCFINGEVEAAEIWESKYRKEIDGVQRKLPSCGRIPPRRWV